MCFFFVQRQLARLLSESNGQQVGIWELRVGFQASYVKLQMHLLFFGMVDKIAGMMKVLCCWQTRLGVRSSRVLSDLCFSEFSELHGNRSSMSLRERKTRHSDEFPDIPSATRPVPQVEGLPSAAPPANIRFGI